jgi:hypothetical protein
MTTMSRRALLGAGLGWASGTCLWGAVRAPDREIGVSEARADLDEMYARLRAAHFDLYARRHRSEYDALFRRMHRALRKPLTRDQLVVALQRFCAFARIAHTYVHEYWGPYERYRANGGRTFPVRTRIRRGRVYLAQPAARRLLPGDEILRLNDEPMQDVLRSMRTAVSADNEYLSDALVEQNFDLWL